MSGRRQAEGVASRIQEYPPASVAGLMVRFGRAEFQRQLFHRIEVVSAEIQVELLRHVLVPRHSGRLGIYRLVQMHGSHEVLFTRPRELTEKITEASRT
jgi:hypothetical protein